MASKFIILSAPSGSGKSTLVSYLLQKIDSLSFSVSSTTRKRRKTEQHGIHYYFITKNEFDNHINKNDFIEWEQVYNNDFKGTLKSEIKRLTDKNKNVIFDVDGELRVNFSQHILTVEQRPHLTDGLVTDTGDHAADVFQHAVSCTSLGPPVFLGVRQ